MNNDINVEGNGKTKRKGNKKSWRSSEGDKKIRKEERLENQWRDEKIRKEEMLEKCKY